MHRVLVNAGFEAPRIGVLGLNPHAGEHGLFGNEDEEMIALRIDIADGQG
jgi:4-hydroxy-L-threonine phosphate dehydrogenase PdxA